MKTIQPAERLSSVNEYYFAGKLKEIAEMNTSGRQVINLGVGSPDLPPSPESIRALCRSARDNHSHGYQPYSGIPELRSSFAAWYKTWYGVDLDASTEIQPLIGSKEGILHISLAFLNPGDGVLVPNPGYPTYTSVSKLVGADIISYDLKEDSGWQPDFDALEKRDLSRVKLMWVNYPNMPTGAPASRALFERLVAFGKRHGIVICNDNPYSFILNDRPSSIFEVGGAKDVCIELNSLSKSHNMPGWRIAMVAGNERFIRWILKVKSNVDSGQFKPMMLAAAEALKASDDWYRENNEIYARRRLLAEEIMSALACSCRQEQVGLFLWGKIPARCAGSEELSNSVLYESNVFITPGFIFGSNGNNYLRISLCCEEVLLREALDRIQKQINN